MEIQFEGDTGLPSRLWFGGSPLEFYGHLNSLKAAITEHAGVEVVGFHKLRTRKAGSHRYIDVHLVMPKQVDVKTAHEMCDHLEHDIKDRLVRTDITIHVEPCDDNCPECQVIACADRRD